MFSHIICPDSLNKTLLSQGCVLETAPKVRMAGRTYIPRTEEEVRRFSLPWSSLKFNQQICPLNDLSQCRHQGSKKVRNYGFRGRISVETYYYAVNPISSSPYPFTLFQGAEMQVPAPLLRPKKRTSTGQLGECNIYVYPAFCEIVAWCLTT